MGMSGFVSAGGDSLRSDYETLLSVLGSNYYIKSQWRKQAKQVSVDYD